MRHRKIRDDELLAMYRSGTPQKEIATAMGVSEPAISKRLKRLLPQPEDVLNKYNLTPQQQRFVVARAKGKTATQAVLESYEVGSMESAKVIGSQLMSRPEIRTVIAELLEIKGYGREYRVQKLGNHMDNADPVVSLKALEMGFKLSNDFPTNSNQNTPPFIALNFSLNDYRIREGDDG
jgi:DNA-binding Lrp family transcriptional regulator